MSRTVDPERYRAGASPSPRRGWIDGLLLLGALWLLGLVATRAVERSARTADIEIVSREATKLHAALVQFHEQNGAYTGPLAAADLDPGTLDPLKRRGYYDGPVTARLVDKRIDAYAARPGAGDRQEFWIEMTLERDPAVRFLVARSDDAPLGGGQWRDGAFVFHDGKLEKIEP